MYRIGIIGDRESVMGFMALGFAVREVSDAGEAREALRLMEQDGGYGIIFVVERYAREMAADLARLADAPLPAVISIPGRTGTDGSGMAAVRKAVERAVGADILFRE